MTLKISAGKVLLSLSTWSTILNVTTDIYIVISVR